MLNFIKKFFIFSLPILVFFVIGEHLVRNLPNEYRNKNDFVIKNGKKIKTIIIGASQLCYTMNPKILGDSTYNFAFPAESFDYHSFILNKYIKFCPNIKNVILELNYLSPYINLENYVENYRATSYKLYMGCPFHSFFSKYNFEFSNRTIFINKLKKITSGDNKVPYYLENGLSTFASIDRRGKKWKNAKYYVERHTSKSRDKVILDNNIKAILDIASTCSKNNIQLLVVTTPSIPEYYNNLDSVQLSKMYEMVETAIHFYPGTVRYLNFWGDHRFNDKDYFDACHLNYEYGSPKISKIIKDVLK